MSDCQHSPPCSESQRAVSHPTDAEFVAQEVIEIPTIQCPNCGYNVAVPEGATFQPCDGEGRDLLDNVVVPDPSDSTGFVEDNERTTPLPELAMK